MIDRSIPSHDDSLVPYALALFIFAALTIAIATVVVRALAASGPVPEYIAGGVGADEMERMTSREREFNLKLVFTLTEGNYVSDVAVVVKDQAGNAVLVLMAPGPLVLARLPRGVYTVDSTYDGRTLTRKVDVGVRLRTEYVRWPSNPATDFPGPKATERE